VKQKKDVDLQLNDLTLDEIEERADFGEIFCY
jgi:hypothetical protein